MPSTVIRRFEYRPTRQELEITFVTGRKYIYHGVPAELYDEMRRSFSKGEFFNARIRSHFAFTQTL